MHIDQRNECNIQHFIGRDTYTIGNNANEYRLGFGNNTHT